MRVLILALLSSLVVLLPAAPATATPTSCDDLEVVAHRGFHAAPGIGENTTAAFQAAVDSGFSVETDVWSDADGQLWVFHDRDVSRATDGTGYIDELSTAYLESLTYLKGGAALVKLEDVLAPSTGVLTASQAAMNTRLYIEIKQATDAKAVSALIEAADRVHTTWISSFTTNVHTADRAIQLLQKEYDGVLETPQELADRGVTIVALLPDDLTPTSVDGYHADGVQVQDRDSEVPAEWQNTIDGGADGQLTDDPADLAPYCRTGHLLPRTDALAPSSGQPGTAVTLTGTDYYDNEDNPLQVTFAGLPATFTFDSPTEITAIAPAGVAAESPVIVTTAAGPSPNPPVFDVPPTITGLSPDTGPIGTTTTISGTTLGETTAVTIGGIGTSFTIASSEQLLAAVPSGVSGPVRVVVTTPGGRTTSPIYFQAPRAASSHPIVVPVTRIRSKTPAILASRHATVVFGAAQATTFVCRLDGKPVACAAPSLTVRHLSAGDHVVTVQAANPHAADLTPAVWKFTVPVDDRRLRPGDAWDRSRSRHAFRHTVLVARHRGATLSHPVRKVRTIRLLIDPSHRGGSVQIFLGSKLLKTVSTRGNTSHRTVRIARFRHRTSGLLRIVAMSDAPVAVDGLTLTRRR